MTGKGTLRPLTVAMIGGGIDSAIGRVHQIAMQMDGRFKLVAGCFSRDARINQLSGLEYGVGIERIRSSDFELVEAEQNKIDAVVIATPIWAHASQIALALDRNLRVISDKPLVARVSEFEAIAGRDCAARHRIFCIFNYTGYPAVREMKRRVEDGQIGRVFKIMAEMPQDSYLRLKNQNRESSIHKWRLKDDEISCVSLDLFVHLHSLVSFVCGKKARSVIAWSRSISGVAANLSDEVDAIIQYEDDMVLNAWYGKAALGYRNGLRIRVLGTQGSLEWYQENPEHLLIADAIGDRLVADRNSTNSLVTALPRYQRFKAGHPAGFIEAFANYYFDIADAIATGEPNPYVLPLTVVGEGLRVAQAIEDSSNTRREVVLE